MAKAKDTYMHVDVGSACITDHPDFTAESTNELLYGEEILVRSYVQDEDETQWAEIETVHDGYAGFVPLDALQEGKSRCTHKVHALRSFVYPDPDVKSLPILALSFLSRVQVTKEEQDGYVRLKDSGWIWKNHLIAVQDVITDYTATAERFIGIPYLWGGRTSFGLDCSALVQLSLTAAGLDCDRDSKDQKQRLKANDVSRDAPLERGDIVFFKGHVGIMVDSKNLLNATARTMDTRIERLSDVAKAYKGITAIKRF